MSSRRSHHNHHSTYETLLYRLVDNVERATLSATIGSELENAISRDLESLTEMMQNGRAKSSDTNLLYEIADGVELIARRVDELSTLHRKLARFTAELDPTEFPLPPEDVSRIWQGRQIDNLYRAVTNIPINATQTSVSTSLSLLNDIVDATEEFRNDALGIAALRHIHSIVAAVERAGAPNAVMTILLRNLNRGLLVIYSILTEAGVNLESEIIDLIQVISVTISRMIDTGGGIISHLFTTYAIEPVQPRDGSAA